MYKLEMTAEQLIELNELLLWYMTNAHPQRGKRVLSQIQEQIDNQLWDTIDDDELWDTYVHTVGADELLQDYRHFVSRTQMIQELTNLRRRG